MPVQVNKFISRIFRKNSSTNVNIDDQATTTTTNNKVVKTKHDYMSERDEWSSKLDFILSCVGYAIGMYYISSNFEETI